MGREYSSNRLLHERQSKNLKGLLVYFKLGYDGFNYIRFSVETACINFLKYIWIHTYGKLEKSPSRPAFLKNSNKINVHISLVVVQLGGIFEKKVRRAPTKLVGRFGRSAKKVPKIRGFFFAGKSLDFGSTSGRGCLISNYMYA